MPRDTKFCADWLSGTDKNGDTISEWCERVPHDPSSARCKACAKTFSIANMGMKNRLHEQLAEQTQLEAIQLAEQETARELISEATKKLTDAVQGSGSNLQGAKVAQAMLSAGNEKLKATAKQLADIKDAKEKIQEKLQKLERRVEEKKRPAMSPAASESAKRRRVQ